MFWLSNYNGIENIYKNKIDNLFANLHSYFSESIFS